MVFLLLRLIDTINVEEYSSRLKRQKTILTSSIIWKDGKQKINHCEGEIKKVKGA